MVYYNQFPLMMGVAVQVIGNMIWAAVPYTPFNMPFKGGNVLPTLFFLFPLAIMQM